MTFVTWSFSKFFLLVIKSNILSSLGKKINSEQIAVPHFDLHLIFEKSSLKN